MEPTKPSNPRSAASWLRKRAENVIVALIAIMFISFLLQIAFRYLLNRPLGWTDEVTVLCWVWLVLWGAAFILSDKDEIRFDIVYGHRFRANPARVHGDFQPGVGRSVRRLAAGFLELRALHEAREVRLSGDAVRLSVLHLRHLFARLHRQARLDRLERVPRHKPRRRWTCSKTGSGSDAQPFHAVHHRPGRARVVRAADRPVDDLRVGVLSAGGRSRPWHSGRADPQRPVQQLCSVGGAAVHPCRGFDEQREPDRPAPEILSCARRSISRRAWSRQRRGEHHLCGHVGIRHCGRRRHWPHHHRNDDAQWKVSHRVRRRDHGFGRHHRADHSTVDSDGRLCTRFRHFDRLSLPWRSHSGAVARRCVHDHEHGDRPAQELSRRAAGSDARDSAHHAGRVSRIDAAGRAAVRHLRRGDDADGGCGGGGGVRAAGIGAHIPLDLAASSCTRSCSRARSRLRRWEC